ncbi:class I SAM-dependent rRNA methyltransferase [Patescibacteria group bacterium]|nr:class I SAM-dependent rRNA methyltransferase [Patescibacteria group bacterium]
MYPLLTLKPGKEVPLRAGHPWVFSEGIAVAPSGLTPGSLVEVQSLHGETLGMGSFHPNQSIAVRMYDKNVVALDADWFAKRISSLASWKRALLPNDTDGFRVVHAENDGIPGVILDLYRDVAVFQIHTAGADLLRDALIEGITQALNPRAIVERSDVAARRQEGLALREPTVCAGTISEPVPFSEAGLTFLADVLHGQKTGFFLDQRQARLAVGRLAKGKRVLNLFSYSGAFSVHVLNGGATHVTSVDVSLPALEAAEAAFKLNGFDDPQDELIDLMQADVLDLIEDPEWKAHADLIVCDPPAFAKTDRDREGALKMYTHLNEACLRQLQPGGILVTSSCSGRVTPEDFRMMLRIASGRAQKRVRLLQWIGHDTDHAELLTYPEGRYLKTAILLVEPE